VKGRTLAVMELRNHRGQEAIALLPSTTSRDGARERIGANERGGDLRHGDKRQPPVDVRVDVPVVKYERVEGAFFVGMLP